jgi:hypothetical protein
MTDSISLLVKCRHCRKPMVLMHLNKPACLKVDYGEFNVPRDADFTICKAYKEYRCDTCHTVQRTYRRYPGL